LKPDLWNESHDKKILEFLSNNERKLLIFYVDEPLEDDKPPSLVIQTDMKIRNNIAQFSYLAKSYYSQEINNKESFHKYIQHGTFGGNHLRSLLRLCSGLYAPLFFDNKTWPDSELKSIS
jgi:hypothetical protein